MTAAEFRAIGLAFYGGAHGWQTAMAERLGVAPRTVRRWASGASRIPPGVAAALKLAQGGADWPRDEWICGEGAPNEGDFRREYIVHTKPPRFIARAVAVDEDDGLPTLDEQPADSLRGLVFVASPDTHLCEIVWLDLPPSDESELRELLDRAATALLDSGE